MPHRSPSRDTSPKWPLSICMKQNAPQLPCVGAPLNWQGQPQLQLQLANSKPCIDHSTYLLIESSISEPLLNQRLRPLLAHDQPPASQGALAIVPRPLDVFKPRPLPPL